MYRCTGPLSQSMRTTGPADGKTCASVPCQMQTRTARNSSASVAYINENRLYHILQCVAVPACSPSSCAPGHDVCQSCSMVCGQVIVPGGENALQAAMQLACVSDADAANALCRLWRSCSRSVHVQAAERLKRVQQISVCSHASLLPNN